MEQAADDLLVVLDAVESERAALIADTYGGWPALLFAAAYPERCTSLVLLDACARLLTRDPPAQGHPRRVAALRAPADTVTPVHERPPALGR
jgi:pimeloyl-ACP methyl ester carboxylesterase